MAISQIEMREKLKKDCSILEIKIKNQKEKIKELQNKLKTQFPFWNDVKKRYLGLLEDYKTNFVTIRKEIDSLYKEYLKNLKIQEGTIELKDLCSIYYEIEPFRLSTKQNIIVEIKYTQRYFDWGDFDNDGTLLDGTNGFIINGVDLAGRFVKKSHSVGLIKFESTNILHEGWNDTELLHEGWNDIEFYAIRRLGWTGIERATLKRVWFEKVYIISPKITDSYLPLPIVLLDDKIEKAINNLKVLVEVNSRRIRFINKFKTDNFPPSHM